MSKSYLPSRRFSSLIWLSVAVLLCPALLWSGVPRRMNFQGKLLDQNNNPRNGSYEITFSIWDNGPSTGVGSMLWSGVQTLSVTNGVVSTQLGKTNPLPASVFTGATTYLQIEIDGEMSGQRQRLTTSPYAFSAAVASDLLPGDADYIQNTNDLQVDAVLHVTSATVGGPFRVEGLLTTTGALVVGDILTVGSSGVQITNSAGFLDATKLTGIISGSQLSGQYSNAVAGGLLPGDTDYLQVRDSLQSGATFYVAKGTVAGPFSASGAVSLGGAPGSADVTINGNLHVDGTGPHDFDGDVQINGNDILDSGGVSRIGLGSNITVNGTLAAAAGQSQLNISTSVLISGQANLDNYIAYPFTAGGTISAKEIVVISGANTVSTTSTAASQDVIGIAVTSASIGQTVYVAMSGIVTDVVTNGGVNQTNFVCTSTTPGRVDDSCNTNGAPIGKALTGATGSGQTITVALFQGR